MTDVQIVVPCSGGSDGAQGDKPTPLTPEQIEAIRLRKVQQQMELAGCISDLSNHGVSTPQCDALFAALRPGEGISREDIRRIAETFVVRIALPQPQVNIGPDPSANEWNMAVVGYPLWLWTPAAGTVTDSTSAGGFPLSITARQASTTFSMGDGGTVTCVAGTPHHPGIALGTPSPDCGYRYQKASLPRGPYTVTATTSWDITWTALGESGTATTTRTTSRQLPVGELQSVVVR